MKFTKSALGIVLTFLPIFCSSQVQNGRLPHGVFATNESSALPLPKSGYQVYLIGETHGIQETRTLLLAYLRLLYRASGLRDVVLEEDQAYQNAALDFTQGRRDDLPIALCLRANMLEALRDGRPIALAIRLRSTGRPSNSASRTVQIRERRNYGEYLSKQRRIANFSILIFPGALAQEVTARSMASNSTHAFSSAKLCPWKRIAHLQNRQ